MTCVLLVVDLQNDFLPGGALAVPGGAEVIPMINRLIERFDHVVLTQDWHPHDHISFASQHKLCRPYDVITLDYGDQVLWPDHCIQGTPGAELSSALHVPKAPWFVRKGFHRNIDSYSAFLEADRRTQTGLGDELRTRGLDDIYICGLATDFCVNWSAQDACAMGFRTTVIEDACRGIDVQGSLQQAWQEMGRMGVRRVCSADLI